MGYIWKIIVISSKHYKDMWIDTMHIKCLVLGYDIEQLFRLKFE